MSSCRQPPVRSAHPSSNMHPTLRLLFVCACVVATKQDAGADTVPTTSTAALLQGVRSVYKTYKQCEVEPSVTGCLKLRALRLVERATSLERIPVVDGISLVSSADSQRSLNDITVDEASLPQEPVQREERIDSLLWDKVSTFFQTHSLQFQVPSLVQESKALLENEILDDDQEGRGKKKKYQGLLLAGLMMKGLMIAAAYKALALLAGKALIVSKLALVLAAIVALRKLFSGGEQKTTYEIVKQPVVSHAHQYTSSHEISGHGASDWAGSASGGYGRSIPQAQDRFDFAPALHGRSLNMDAVPYPHLVAYRGQLPKNVEQQSTEKS